MARSNRKRRQAGMKFDGYIFFWGGGLRTRIAIKKKKGRKIEKERKKK